MAVFARSLAATASQPRQPTALAVLILAGLFRGLLVRFSDSLFHFTQILAVPPASQTCMTNKRILRAKEVLTQARRKLDQIQKTGATFFLTDLDVAMTLVNIASGAPKDSEKRSRNQANARHAYDEVSRISHASVLSENDRHDVDEKLAELRSALQQLGEEFA